MKLLKSNFIYIFTLLLVMFVLQFDFSEDGIYRAQVFSFLHDLDLNLINQLSNSSLGWIITKTGYHPSHHLHYQVPGLLLFYFVEKVINIFGTFQGQTVFKLTSILFQIVATYIGLKLTSSSLRKLGLRLRNVDVIWLFLSTSLFYFWFFTLNLIELFYFPLTAYVFYCMVSIFKKDFESISLFKLGLSLGILVTGKFFFVIVIPYFIYEILNNKSETKTIEKVSFIAGIAIMYMAYLTTIYTKYGSFDYPIYAFNNIFNYSFLNLFIKIRGSLFGPGGLFASNIIYLFSLLSITSMCIIKIRDRRAVFFYATCLAWGLFSLFSSALLVGPLIEDHYMGRLGLNSLPVLILGMVLFIKTLNDRIAYYSLVSITCVFSIYSTISFISIEANGHYLYNIEKYVLDFSNFSNISYILSLFILNINSIIYIFMGSVFLAIFIKLINSDAPKKVLSYTIYVYALLIVLISIVDSFNGQRNIQHQRSDKYSEYVVGNGSEIYIYNYVIDFLTATELSTTNKTILKDIHIKREAFKKKALKQVLIDPKGKLNSLESGEDFNPYLK